MVLSFDQIVILWVAVVLGVLLCIIVVAFVSSPKFRRDVLEYGQEGGVSASGDTGEGEASNTTVHFRAKGVIIGLVFIFLAAMISLTALLYLSKGKFAPKETVNVVKNKTEEINTQLEKEAAVGSEDVSVSLLEQKVLYIGEFPRSGYGEHFPCGTDVRVAAAQVCRSKTPVSVAATSTHSGNRCGYSYYSVLCSPN